MNVRWFEDFFHGIALDLWRKAVPPERTRAEAGLSVESLSGSPEGEPFRVGTPYLLLVAEKR